MTDGIFAEGKRVKVKYGYRPGHFATLVEACNMSSTPTWVIRYDDGMQETQYAHNLEALVSEETVLQPGMRVRHTPSQTIYRLVERAENDWWRGCHDSDKDQKGPRFKLYSTDLVVLEDEDEEVVLKPEKLSAKKGAALPEKKRSRPKLVGGPVVEEVTDDSLLVQLEALKLELDRAKVEAAKWEKAYGDRGEMVARLTVEGQELLAENAKLRRKLEALERKKR